MAFILEDLTDEDRKKHGFAPTMDDVQVGKGMSFVDRWAVDKERDAAIICTFFGATIWQFELHWGNNVIALATRARRQSREEVNTKSNIHEVDVFFHVKELIVPYLLEEKVDIIKNLVDEGLQKYACGSHKYNGNGFVEFPPDMTIRFSKLIKSKVKLADFEQIH